MKAFEPYYLQKPGEIQRDLTYAQVGQLFDGLQPKVDLGLKKVVNLIKMKIGILRLAQNELLVQIHG